MVVPKSLRQLQSCKSLKTNGREQEPEIYAYASHPGGPKMGAQKRKLAHIGMRLTYYTRWSELQMLI